MNGSIIEERLVAEMNEQRKMDQLQSYIAALPVKTAASHGLYSKRKLAETFIKNEGSVMKTAEELGMAKNSVTRRLKELGFKGPAKADRALDFEKIRKLHSRGKSLRAIGIQYGIDHTTVAKIVRGETPNFKGRGHLKTTIPDDEVVQAAIAKRQKDMELLENIPNLPPHQRFVVETWIDSDLSAAKAAKKLFLDRTTIQHKIKEAGYQGFEMPVETAEHATEACGPSAASRGVQGSSIGNRLSSRIGSPS